MARPGETVEKKEELVYLETETWYDFAQKTKIRTQFAEPQRLVIMLSLSAAVAGA